MSLTEGFLLLYMDYINVTKCKMKFPQYWAKETLKVSIKLPMDHKFNTVHITVVFKMYTYFYIWSLVRIFV